MNLTFQKQQAWALFNEGKPDEAKAVCEDLRRRNAMDAEAFYLLGSCYGILEEYAEAVTAFQDSLKMQPATPESHFALGGALLKLGRLDEAVEQFRSVLVLAPKMVEAHCALAEALCTLGLTVDAQEHCETARRLRPDLGAPYIGLGMVSASRDGNRKEALAYFEEAVKREPENPNFQCHLGMALSEARVNEEMNTFYQKAHACFQEALRVAPGYPDALAGSAHLFSLEGKYDQALEQIEVLRGRGVLSATAAIAFTNVCKQFGRCDEAAEYAITVLEKRKLAKRTFGALSMHLARTLDQLERYDEAWPHFVAGNTATAQFYDAAGFRLRVEKTMKVFSQAGLFSLPRSDVTSQRPVFIVGMPRSGTSLVEQIMAAHPRIYGGGELTFLSDIMVNLPARIGSKNKWPDCASELTRDNLNDMAHWYLERLDGISKTADRVTDKMPHNFSELGLLQLVFPGARVIHCKRDPKDTCLSIYFQNFLLGHEYAKNLYHIGTHYHQYQQLMEHWKHYLTIPVLEVQYEELVRDPEPVVRRMLEHCELEWHEGCLEFHKSKRLVNTASYDQVRQPLYSRSVERWRHYERYLGDLEKGLERGF